MHDKHLTVLLGFNSAQIDFLSRQLKSRDSGVNIIAPPIRTSEKTWQTENRYVVDALKKLANETDRLIEGNITPRLSFWYKLERAEGIQFVDRLFPGASKLIAPHIFVPPFDVSNATASEKFISKTWKFVRSFHDAIVLRINQRKAQLAFALPPRNFEVSWGIELMHTSLLGSDADVSAEFDRLERLIRPYGRKVEAGGRRLKNRNGLSFSPAPSGERHGRIWPDIDAAAERQETLIVGKDAWNELFCRLAGVFRLGATIPIGWHFHVYDGDDHVRRKIRGKFYACVCYRDLQEDITSKAFDYLNAYANDRIRGGYTT